LINAVMEEKVSIVSSVAQTTRNLIRSILTEPRGQLVFLDTPGIHKAESDLGHLMNKMARTAIDGVDVILLVLDASTSPRLEDEGWMRRLLFQEEPVIFLLNKEDRPPSRAEEYRALWTRIQEEKETTKPVLWLNASALKAEGVDNLLQVLFDAMPVGPLLFPDDILTDFPRKLNIADVVREKFFHLLRDEVPHDLAVQVEQVSEAPEGGCLARGKIFVNRNSQKGIVLGNKGRVFKRALREAEEELTEMYQQPVKLDLWVTVEKNWAKNYFLLRQLGYQ
ncbi:MAG: GTPase Era, partial [Spartobacteria bacterium]|nr:GTPase Era [Spartobacteria bacterium]